MADNSEVSLGTLAQISMRARNLTRAVAFYRDKLGVRHLFDAGPKLSFFDCDGVRLMLSEPEGEEFDHPGSILYFRVPDIQLAYRTLKDRGVEFRDEPHLVARMPDHELWLASMRDSEDNTLALMSEVRG